MNRLYPSELIVFPDGLTYRRTGECACARIGQCCTYITLPLARELSTDEGYWAELHEGLKVIGATVRIPIACNALTEEGRCSLYGMPQRPQICKDYPERPGLDPGCTYRFERLSDRPLEKESVNWQAH